MILEIKRAFPAMTKKKRKRVKKIRKVKRQPPEYVSEARSLGERNRVALAYLELARDRIFQELPEGRKLELIDEVLGIGDEVAGWVKAEHGSSDPRKIAARLGIRVFGEDRGVTVRSEYRPHKKEIVICRNFHQKLLREVKSPELMEHLLKFVVAHELFRHLEFNRIGQVYKRFEFEGRRIGPYVKKNFIRGLSNVAAQAFTHSLLGLEISPQVFDYLTYILYTNP